MPRSGAVRRNQATDEIELLALAKRSAANLFGEAEPDLQAIVDTVSGWGDVTRRGDGALVCTLREASGSAGRPGQRVVVYTVVSADAWGSTMLRLTGPGSFVSFVAERLAQNGYTMDARGEGLRGVRGGMIGTPDEATVFRLAGIDFVQPEQRVADGNAAGAARGDTERDHVRSAPSRNATEHQGRGMPIERD